MNWFKSFLQGFTTPMSREGAGSPEPLHNFTPRAQQVLALARREADRFHHNFVGTEHLLLGIIRLNQGTAVAVLKKMGLDLETVRMEVEKQVGTGPDEKMVGNIPYTPRVKKVLALAAKESRFLNHTYVGTEHILLGMLREADGVAARVLSNLDVNVEETRQAVLQELDPNFQVSSVEYVVPEKESKKKQDDMIDLSKRYDVYCKEGSDAVVYRNVLFKGMKKLFHVERYSIFMEYVEVEQADGKTIFFSRASIIKFCEHGVTPGSQSVDEKKE
jgi:Clp amino terminal domain, pathogenicity island component